jgi:hypothetical protein
VKIDPFLVPAGPYWTKLHLRVTGRRLEVVSEELRGEEEVVFPDLRTDDEFDIPKKLGGLLHEGHAKVVRVDDDEAMTVLSQLEGLAYRDDSLTFILHHTRHQNYILCLVGEKVTTDTTWRHAGKVITALQEQFYGRKKSGRPTKAAKKAALESGPPKDEANALVPAPTTQSAPESQVQPAPASVRQLVVLSPNPAVQLAKARQRLRDVERKVRNRPQD